jgi:uncharacterized membrane protein
VGAFSSVASGLHESIAERIEIVPNCSLSTRGALVFFGSVCLASFGIATVLSFRGFWPVLPFAGLEMALLGWALLRSMQRRHQLETITVSDIDVRIEHSDPAHYVEVVFPRHWARVKLRRPHSRLHPSRLTIESQGRHCEVGSFLTEQERRGLAQRLQRLIGRMNESPSLA